MEFALIHLRQILEEHLCGTQIDLEMISQLLFDLERVAICQPDQEGSCVNREGHEESTQVDTSGSIGCVTLGERVPMPGSQFL